VSVQDEREFRERLEGLLDGIEPAPAPVFRAMRQGRGIRMRRWVSAAAALAVLAAAAVGVPFFLHQEGRVAPIAPLHYSVTVDQPSSHWRSGVIGEGTENGRRWSVGLNGQTSDLTITGSGLTNYVTNTFVPIGETVTTEQFGTPGPHGTLTVVGLVSKSVTSVTVYMSNGEVLNLRAVSYGGQRYVALTIPRYAHIASAEAMRGDVELAYSIPYQQALLDNWWLPGQTPPARATKTLASGVYHGQAWRIEAQFGPWGDCWDITGGSYCPDALHPYEMTAGQLDQGITCNPSGQSPPLYVLVAVRSDIRRVVVTFHNQHRESLQAAEVGGMRFLLVMTTHRGRIDTAIGYNGAGRPVGPITNLEQDCGQ
jgi:hypothetical protein